MEWDLAIVLILYKPSVVAKTIERKLTECGYKVVTVAREVTNYLSAGRYCR